MFKPFKLADTIAVLSGILLVWEIAYILGINPVGEGQNFFITLIYACAVGGVVYLLGIDANKANSRLKNLIVDNSTALTKLGLVAIVQTVIFLVWLIPLSPSRRERRRDAVR